MKLIFFDIDGTLIPDNSQQMSPSTILAIETAKKNGHVCMVNTGRSYKLVGGWLPAQVDFDGYLCGIGTHIIYKNQCLLHETFDCETAQRIIDGLEKYHIDAVLEGAENNYHNRFEKMHTKEFYDFMKRFSHMHYGFYDEAPGCFDKFYCLAPNKSQIEGFQNEFGDILDVIDRQKGYYEIGPKGYSKAGAIRFMADYLKVPMEETVAIGDSNNDLQMLSAAHTAIAMGNANDAVKNIADYITTDVSEDGIYHALDWLGVL